MAPTRHSRRKPLRAKQLYFARLSSAGLSSAGLCLAEELQDRRVDHVGSFEVAVVPAAGDFLVTAVGNALGYLAAEERRHDQIVGVAYDQARSRDLPVGLQPVTRQDGAALRPADLAILRP